MVEARIKSLESEKEHLRTMVTQMEKQIYELGSKKRKAEEVFEHHLSELEKHKEAYKDEIREIEKKIIALEEYERKLEKKIRA